MIEYTLEGKVDPEIFDLILFDIDHKVDVKIICGPNINNNDANKIAALGLPVFVKRAAVDSGVKETVENLVNNEAECVVIELPISALGLHLGRVYEFVYEYITERSYAGTKLCLIDAMSTPHIVTDDQWNSLIVHCIDNNISLCWAYDAAGARYTKYLRSIA